ncbi:MAG: hypothetical protein LUC41_05995 [Clostridiales bacterium]|nr:hypothetical protein [Clostridiales bacterium]
MAGKEYDKHELLELGNRMLRLKYDLDSNHMGLIFSGISLSDYIILLRLSRTMGIHEPEAKVYLSDIQKEMEVPMSNVSRVVQRLQDKGYVYWKHDKQGTYIFLSETGREAMKSQQETLRFFMQNVIDRVGIDDFIHVLDEMHRMEEIMDEEADLIIKAAEEDAGNIEE